MSVQHQVTAERAGWHYFRKRCLAEGRSKTLVVNAVGSGDGLASESRYVMRVLPAGVVRAIGEAIFKLDPWALARAGGIFFGLGYTAMGYHRRAAGQRTEASMNDPAFPTDQDSRRRRLQRR